MDSLLNFLQANGGFLGIGGGVTAMVVVLRASSAATDRYKEVKEDAQATLERERLNWAREKSELIAMINVERETRLSERASLQGEINSLRTQMIELSALVYNHRTGEDPK